MQYFKFPRSIAGFIAILLLITSLSAAAAETYPFTCFATSDLRMRSSPSSSALVLLTIPVGEAVLVTGLSGDYYIIEYEGNYGYALRTFLSTANPYENDSLSDTNLGNSIYTLLKAGMAGVLIKTLQEALAELNFYTGSIDSKYGSGTASAVKSFQAMNALSESGIADSVTQKLLFEGKPKNSQGIKMAVQTLPYIIGFSIREGGRGDLVVALQQRLKELGYFSGSIDGICGAATISAVKLFQKNSKLKDDGIAGQETQAVLYGEGALAAGVTATPSPIVTASPVPAAVSEAVYPYTTTATASVNMRETASVSGKRILTVPSGATISVLENKGSFLKVTYKAYTGYVMTLYVDVPLQYMSGNTLKPDAIASRNYDTLTSGDSGYKVRALQQALHELGFYNKDIDGAFGSGTIAAVKALQSKNGYVQTGIAYPELQQLIFEGRPRNNSGIKRDVKTLPPIEGYTMRLHDEGDAVKALQTALAQTGYYSGTVSGVYDSKTAAAVKAFQSDHNLTADGIAGLKTQNAINKAVATATPYLSTPAPTNTTLTEDNVVIVQLGTRGLAVTRLQTRLVELGFYSIVPDGICSGDDVIAIRAFQKKNGLKADGIAGLQTQLAIYAGSAISADATASPSPTPAPTPNVQKTLKIGSSGPEVKLLQARLITLKYLTGTADGIFGTKTAIAVTSFQKNNNLAADGIAGATTLSKLYSSSALSAPAATPTPTPPSTLLRIGSSGAAVKSMQKRLAALGYLSGSADGVFGPATYLALKAFQARNGLNPDGIAGPNTLVLLNALSALPAENNPAPGTDTFTPPRAAEVRFANWYTEIRSRTKNMPDVIIYDFATGLHYNLHMFSFGQHADSEPPTAGDTAVMKEIIGENNWTPRAVWVIFSDGRVYMGSTHSHGHEVDHTSGNNLTGHVCLHFPRDLSEAAITGPYAVTHQNTILLGWEATQALIN